MPHECKLLDVRNFVSDVCYQASLAGCDLFRKSNNMLAIKDRVDENSSHSTSQSTSSVTVSNTTQSRHPISSVSKSYPVIRV